VFCHTTSTEIIAIAYDFVISSSRWIYDRRQHRPYMWQCGLIVRLPRSLCCPTGQVGFTTSGTDTGGHPRIRTEQPKLLRLCFTIARSHGWYVYVYVYVCSPSSVPCGIAAGAGASASTSASAASGGTCGSTSSRCLKTTFVDVLERFLSMCNIDLCQCSKAMFVDLNKTIVVDV
jgi:hypothetical protein